MDEVGNWGDRCTLNCGSCLWGIPVRIHYTYFILWVVEVIITAAHYHLIQYTMVVFLLYGPVLLVTILIHEFGHALMNRRFGGHVDHILIWPLGGFAIIGPTGGNVLEDFWVAFAGPLTHVPQIVFWIVIFALSAEFNFSEFDFQIRFYELKGGGPGPFFKVLSMQSVELNLILIIFNLFVPAYPLDGGRCLAALLVHYGVAVVKAAVITAVTAIIAAVVLVIYGFYTLVAQGRGTGFFFILVAIFIIISSVNLFRMAKTGRVYEHPLFDRPCYRQRDSGQSGGNTGSGTKKKKVIKKKKPVDDDDLCDIESPPPEAPVEPSIVKKSTKPSVKKSQSTDPNRQSSTKKTTTTKKSPPGEANQFSNQASSVKKKKPSVSGKSTKTKKSEPTTDEAKKSTKKAGASTKDTKTEVKPVTRKTNMNETEQIENKFDDIKRKFENRKAGIYEP